MAWIVRWVPNFAAISALMAFQSAFTVLLWQSQSSSSGVHSWLVLLGGNSVD
jgi:hypothetical protein